MARLCDRLLGLWMLVWANGIARLRLLRRVLRLRFGCGMSLRCWSWPTLRLGLGMRLRLILGTRLGLGARRGLRARLGRGRLRMRLGCWLRVLWG